MLIVLNFAHLRHKLEMGTDNQYMLYINTNTPYKHKHTSNNRRDHKYTEKGKCFTQTAVTIQIA